MKTLLIAFILFSCPIFCFGQQGFENQYAKVEIHFKRTADSAHFELKLTNKSNESIFLPVHNPMYSKIWKIKSAPDLVELGLGYDWKMVTEGTPEFSRIGPSQTIVHRSTMFLSADEQYRIKFIANLFMSEKSTYSKEGARLEWFIIDFKLP